MENCQFCEIVSRSQPAKYIFEDEDFIIFLDHHPLFLGHSLIIPKKHYATLADMPASLLGSFFTQVQNLSKAIQIALSADGTFVAMNNIVSQSVPHFHVHVIPRKKGDGLKGFFWPRQKYSSEEEMQQIRSSIQKALGSQKSLGPS
jgi:histidine triad (HIT) family protein